jgi:drug/metabolite transporter (DMT)-like permease
VDVHFCACGQGTTTRFSASLIHNLSNPKKPLRGFFCGPRPASYKDAAVLIVIAYLLVILIWSTTPLALQASQDGINFFTAALLRMVASAILTLPILLLLRQPLRLQRSALISYLAGSVGIYGAMMAVYWAAPFIPSGLISVLYGLSPMLSGAIAWFWLGERELTPVRVVALVLALLGLGLVVLARLQLDGLAWRGILGTLVSVVCFAVSAVWVKQADAGLHPMVQTSGSLWVSLVFYGLSLPFFEFQLPQQWVFRSAFAISYLVIFGSLLGFMLYFLVLKHLSAARVTLITLVAPVLAVLWGYWLNGETLQWATVQGVALLLGALALYQWHQTADRLLLVLWQRLRF